MHAARALRSSSTATLVRSAMQACFQRSQATLAMPGFDDDDVTMPAGLADETEAVTSEQYKSFAEMPGPRGLPVIGNIGAYSRLGKYSFEKILDNRLDYMRQYGKIYRERLGPMSMVHLFDPTDLATMFRLEGKYPSRGKIAGLEVSYLERNNKLVGFAFRDGPEWARQRGCIQRLMMHPGTAARYLDFQMPVAADFADYLGSIRQADGLVPDLYDNLFKFTMESIGAVCFGERIRVFGPGSEQNDEARRLSAAISETFLCFRSCMFDFPWYRYFRTPTYQRFERAANTMRQIMGKYVAAAQQRTRDLPSVGASDALPDGTCPFSHAFAASLERGENPCVLDMLSRDQRVEPELRTNLVMALFRTGIDSTGNGLAFFLHNLASNPDKQAALYEEISAELPSNAQPTGEVLQRMPYLKACLKESFRLHYPVFGGSGRVMPEDTVFSGYKVPKGTFIFANMAAMSRMEEYFPRPLQYHPERWLRGERASLTSQWPTDAGFLSLPFSHGLRACPGKRFAEQGLYTAVIAILRRYRLESQNDGMGMIHMPFTIPDRPLKIKFVARDGSDDNRRPQSASSTQQGGEQRPATATPSQSSETTRKSKCPFHRLL